MPGIKCPQMGSQLNDLHDDTSTNGTAGYFKKLALPAGQRSFRGPGKLFRQCD